MIVTFRFVRMAVNFHSSSDMLNRLVTSRFFFENCCPMHIYVNGGLMFNGPSSIKAIGRFEWIYINLSKSAAFSLQTPENNLKPPYNPFKRQIKVQQWFTTRGSNVHNPMVEFWAASRKCYIFQLSQNKDGFRQNDSQGFLEFIKLYFYKQNPNREHFIFNIYQNYTLALMGHEISLYELRINRWRNKQLIHNINNPVNVLLCYLQFPVTATASLWIMNLALLRGTKPSST